MDPDITLILTASLPTGIPKSNIAVELRETYNREILPSQEGNVDRIWELRKKQNPRLFDGSKFRFHSVDMDKKTNEVTFCLGLTGYKDFIGTNWADNAAELLECGRKELGNSQGYMSDALGVGALVLTVDDCAVFIRRSQHVGEAQGLWDIPGGHPEPGEVQGGAADPREAVLSDLAELGVRDELMSSTIREIRDEINIPESELGEPHLMGIARNHTSSGRPSAEFLVKCSLHSSDVRELYEAGGAEAEESTGLQLVPLSDIYNLERTDMWKMMAPSGKGAVKLYTTVMDRT